MPPLRPNVIDIEASGFGADSYPIEVGVVLTSGEKYCTLIKPEPAWSHWDTAAEQVHGLSKDDLYLHGKPVATVAQELNRLLANQTIYSDGWVVDKPWLLRLFQQSGIAPSFYMSPLELILKEPQMEIWAQIKLHVIADLALTRHRASSDALIIQETYARTRQTLYQSGALVH